MSKNYVIVATEEKQDAITACEALKKTYGNDVIFSNGEDDVIIKPIKLTRRNGSVLLLYQLMNVKVRGKKHIFSCGMTGCSSTMDYLVFETDNLDADLGSLIPIFSMEETKTTEDESGNTSTYQRLTKCVYITLFYPDVPRTYYYNTRKKNVVEKGTSANVAYMIRVILGVEQFGKDIKPRKEVEEICNRYKSAQTPEEKRAMAEEMLMTLQATINSSVVNSDKIIPYRLLLDDPEHPLTSNVRIQARLGKGKYVNICNDPSEGFVAGVVAALEALGNTGDVTFINHRLEKNALERQRTNKLLQILKVCERDFYFDGIGKFDKSRIRLSKKYLREAYPGEKNSSIPFECMMDGGRRDGKSADGTLRVIFDNHAGCSKSFFRTADDVLKDTKKEKGIPDLVILDTKNVKIYVIEAEMSKNVEGGLKQLSTFETWFKEKFLDEYYPGYEIVSGVITYGDPRYTENVDNPRLWLNVDTNYNFDARETMPKPLLDIIKKEMPRVINEEELSQFTA